MDAKLDILIEGGSKSTISAPKPKPSTQAPEPTTVKPTSVIKKQQEEEKPPVDGRRVCPECGGTTFNELEDKSHLLHQMGLVKIYAKKIVCKRCSKEM